MLVQTECRRKCGEQYPAGPREQVVQFVKCGRLVFEVEGLRKRVHKWSIHRKEVLLETNIPERT